MQATDKNPGSPRRHHRRRWIIAGVAAVVVLISIAAASLRSQPSPAPLTLATGAVTAPARAGEIDGTWNTSAGSVAGFRVRQTVLGTSTDIVGRTYTITGSATISQARLTAATFRVDLTTIKVNGKTQPQFSRSLETQRYPDATLTLTQPITLRPDVTTGATVTAMAAGQLTLHGVTRAVAFPITGRRDGPALETVGSIPITFSDWDIEPPKNYGPLGSLADHGVAEFLLVLRQH